MSVLPPDLRDGDRLVADIWFRIAVISFGALTVLMMAVVVFMH